MTAPNEIIEMSLWEASTLVDPCNALETDIENSSRTIAQTLSPNTPIAGPPRPPRPRQGGLDMQVHRRQAEHGQSQLADEDEPPERGAEGQREVLPGRDGRGALRRRGGRRAVCELRRVARPVLAGSQRVVSSLV